MAGIGAQADDRHFNRGRSEGVVRYVNDTAEMSQWVKSDVIGSQIHVRLWPRKPTSGANGARLHPALELAHGELPDHQHAGFTVVEAGNGYEVHPAIALEHAGVVDRDLLQRL